MITLFDHPRSGNCHKVRLLLSILRIPYESRFVEVLKGVNHEPWFVAINPLRQVPALTDGGYTIQDSQAVLTYLAGRYGPDWISREPEELARIVEWLSFAANEIGGSLQPARLFYILGEEFDIAKLHEKGRRALAHLDAVLAERPWLAVDRPTIADLACFPYVGLSREGRLPLDEYRNVLGWIDRIVALDGYVTMEGLPPVPVGRSAR